GDRPHHRPLLPRPRRHRPGGLGLCPLAAGLRPLHGQRRPERPFLRNTVDPPHAPLLLARHEGLRADEPREALVNRVARAWPVVVLVALCLGGAVASAVKAERSTGKEFQAEAVVAYKISGEDRIL